MTVLRSTKAMLQWISERRRFMSYAAGSLFVSLWTMLLFFIKPTIYDLVTQQVLAHSWLHGYHQSVTLGPTNYLLKLFILYMPTDLLPGSPRLKLILLTVIINVVTFVALFWLMEKILEEFQLPRKTYLQIGMLWLSLIASSMFWIQFANSRNLEVAGSMFLVWLVIRATHRPSRRILISLPLVASIVFFSDTLQLYMVGIPLLLYVAALVLYRKLPRKQAWFIMGALAVGAAIAHLAVLGVNHLLKIQVIEVGSLSVHQLMAHLIHSIFQAARATVRQFSGGIATGRLPQLANIVFFGAALGSFIWACYRRYVPKRFVLLVGLFGLINELVYIVSGEANQGDTSRYLIMLGPFIVLVIASLATMYGSRKIPLLMAMTVLLIDALFLLTSLGSAWNLQFPADAHLASSRQYLNSHSYTFAYGSMDTATPIAYYGGLTHTFLAPLACDNTQLVRADSFRSQPTSKGTVIPIVLDQTAIHNTPYACTRETIIKQFGPPTDEQQLSDGSQVLLYSTQTLESLQ